MQDSVPRLLMGGTLGLTITQPGSGGLWPPPGREGEVSAGAGLHVLPQLPEPEPSGAPLLAMTHRCAQAAAMRQRKSFLLFSSPVFLY